MMIIQAAAGRIEASAADAIILHLFEGSAPTDGTAFVDAALDGAIRDLVAGGDFSGKLGEVAVLYPRGILPARRVLIAGLGPRESLTAETVRRASASAVLKARDLKVKAAASLIHGTGAGGLPVEVAAQAVTEGSLLALYTYHGQKTAEVPEDFPKSLKG